MGLVLYVLLLNSINGVHYNIACRRGKRNDTPRYAMWGGSFCVLSRYLSNISTNH